MSFSETRSLRIYCQKAECKRFLTKIYEGQYGSVYERCKCGTNYKISPQNGKKRFETEEVKVWIENHNGKNSMHPVGGNGRTWELVKIIGYECLISSMLSEQQWK